MKQKFTAVVIVILFSFLKFNGVNAQVNMQDSLVLVDFYNSTNGPHWSRHDNWLTKSPVSTWFGVRITANRVTQLSFTLNNINGVIPSSIGNLTGLTSLQIRINQLKGRIPDSIGYLTNLTEIDFFNNQLTGSLPSSVGNLINLDTLNLLENELSGPIPASFSKLKKMTYLSLDGNGGITGNISFLAKLPNLQVIDLCANQLSGKIPVLNNANLRYLCLAANQLSGNIPMFGKDTASDIAIILEGNNLTGSINHQFDSLANLSYLALDNNQLTGKIPASLNKLVHLATLDLSYNQLSSKIPFLDSLTDLFWFHLESNQFTFNGMEDIANHFPNAVYSPQANISIQQNGNLLKVSAGGTLANNTYKWYKNGSLFKTKTGNASLTVNGNGNYSVDVTNSVATALTLYSDTISYAGFTSNISQAEKQNTFSTITAYPNPANKIVTVTFKATGKYSITVTDVSGKILQTKNAVAFKEKNFVQLDISKYANGVYFITIKDESNHQQTIKLNKE